MSAFCLARFLLQKRSVQIAIIPHSDKPPSRAIFAAFDVLALAAATVEPVGVPPSVGLVPAVATAGPADDPASVWPAPAAAIAGSAGDPAFAVSVPVAVIAAIAVAGMPA